MNQSEEFEIIFIDDDAEITESYLKNFNREGFKTIVFSESDEAISYINKNFNKIILIFTDQNMPGNKGTGLINSSSLRQRKFPQSWFPDILTLTL